MDIFKTRNENQTIKNLFNQLKNVDGIAQVYLDDNDIVRHKLVKRIISAYKSIETD